MFYKILFVLAAYNLYKSIKGFYNEYILFRDDACAELSIMACVDVTLAVLFYVMVMAICILPSIIF